jgi:ribosomal protein S18 acetylase RimI-like enzyme
MDFEWIDSSDAVDWEELSTLYRLAPLGNKMPSDLQTAFSNSMFKCFVFAAGRLMGAGRVLADGVDCAYLCDVAVHPECQGRGIGRELVARLVALSAGHKKIILYAVPGKEPMYRKAGFRAMTTAMAIFEDQDLALERGLILENEVSDSSAGDIGPAPNDTVSDFLSELT